MKAEVVVLGSPSLIVNKNTNYGLCGRKATSEEVLSSELSHPSHQGQEEEKSSLQQSGPTQSAATSG